jgi:hypothetical protein
VCRDAADVVFVYNSKNIIVYWYGIANIILYWYGIANIIVYWYGIANIIVYWYGIAYFTDVELTVLNAFNNLKTLKMRNI